MWETKLKLSSGKFGNYFEGNLATNPAFLPTSMELRPWHKRNKFKFNVEQFRMSSRFLSAWVSVSFRRFLFYVRLVVFELYRLNFAKKVAVATIGSKRLHIKKRLHTSTLVGRRAQSCVYSCDSLFYLL